MLYKLHTLKEQLTMKIEIELTKLEELYISQNCIARVVKSAINELPTDYEYMEDMIELGEIMEPLRFKLNDAIFRAKMKG